MRRKNWELKGIFWIITLLFVGFLAAPILLLLGKSLLGDGGLTGEFYVSVVTRDGFLTALGNSFAVAETIIVGSVPDSYTYFHSDEETAEDYIVNNA